MWFQYAFIAHVPVIASELLLVLTKIFLNSLYVCMAIKYIIVLFVETPRHAHIFIICLIECEHFKHLLFNKCTV